MSNLMDNSESFVAIINDIAALELNVRDFAIVDMADADYTLTDAQAVAAGKAIDNTGDGTKTATLPTSADAQTPAIQSIIMTTGTNQAIFAAESGGATATVFSNDGSTGIDILLKLPFFGMFSFIAQAVKSANKMMSSAPETVTDDTDVIGSHSGVLLQMDNAAPKAFNFSDANVTAMTPNAKGWLRMKGAGVVTITASGTATVEGKTTLAINDIVTWYREGSTTNIIVG